MLDVGLVSIALLLAFQAAVFSAKHWISASGILFPAARSAAQLAGMAVVLGLLFRTESVALALGLLTAMVFAGIQVVRSRCGVPTREWSNGDTVDLAGILFGLTGVAAAVLAFAGEGSWVRTVVPSVGLVIGNTLSALSVSIERLRSSVRSERPAIESRLLTGADVEEAIHPLIAPALRAGMTPILGAMSGAGLVSLPGALSGQLIAGGDPVTAVKVQWLVLGSICLAAGWSTAILLRLWLRRRIDFEREVLHSDVFT